MENANTYLLMLLLGQIVPPATDVINKHVSSAKVRFLASLLVSLVIAIGANYERLNVGSVEEALLSFLIIFASGSTAYKMYYEGSAYQGGIRHNTKLIPFRELIPPVDMLAPKLSSIKSSLIKPQ